VVGARQPAGPAALHLALGRDPRAQAAPLLAGQEGLGEPVVDEVPGQPLLDRRLAQHEEVGIVRPAAQRPPHVPLELAVGQLQQVGAAPVAAREERLQRRLAGAHEVDVDAQRPQLTLE
jgi:hypothetical protein